LELLGEPVPADWKRKFALAGDFYNRIRRTDGTLPMFGDTDGQPDETGRHVAWSIGQESRTPDPPAKVPGLSLYPVSGFAVWQDDSGGEPEPGISQTVVAWSYFSGFGHKHADEPSINFWANGQAWWNGVGYWSYDDPHRKAAESWEGSNAPHLVGEPANSS